MGWRSFAPSRPATLSASPAGPAVQRVMPIGEPRGYRHAVAAPALAGRGSITAAPSLAAVAALGARVCRARRTCVNNAIAAPFHRKFNTLRISIGS